MGLNHFVIAPYVPSALGGAKTKKQLIKELTELREQITELRASNGQKVLSEVKQHTSEDLFRKTLEEGPIGMAVANPSFQIVEVNEAFCQMLGYTKQELKIGIIGIDAIKNPIYDKYTKYVNTPPRIPITNPSMIIMKNFVICMLYT